MLDIKLIRQNPQKVKEGCIKKQVLIDTDLILKIDQEKRKYQKRIEELRGEQRKLSFKEQIPFKQLKGIKNEIKSLEPKLKEKETELRKLLLSIPNLPLDNVPIGKDERDNVVLRKEGEIPNFDFEVKDHLEIGERLDLTDVKRAAKVAGARFAYLKRRAVLLEFALVNLSFDMLLKEGFIPLNPPVMIKREIMEGMGYISTKKDLAERYFLEKDKLFLVGTAEQSIGPMHKDEVFEEKELPRRYLAFSTCFREEAGSYGKDTRGILRVHQFDKLEMFSFCSPGQSDREHDFFLNLEEKLMRKLKLSYRVMKICSGDMAFPTAKQYDIETWFPSQKKYRETQSTSNCTDFQARRLNIRYKCQMSLHQSKLGTGQADVKSQKLEFVHMVNGTAFAVGRTLIAILENYQQKDGSVKVPKVLQKYTKFSKITNRF